MKSSSPGVARPKMETSPRTRPLSGFTSSTVPLKFENGPSTTRTLSPSSNSTFGLGFSAPSESCVVSRAISCSLTAGGLVALPTKPVILGVFFTRCQVRSFSSICTRMYPGKNFRFEARFSPFTISTTFSIGMRMSPKYSSSEFCLIFSSRDFFALFSKPEYVWTTYHFLSIFFSSAAIGILLSDARVLDLVRQELPEHVEEAEQHVLEEEARGEREHDVSDGHQLLVRHRSTEAIGRPARTRTWNMRFWRPPLYHWSYWPVALAYFVSLCSVCLRQRGQNFGSTSLSVMVRLFFVVA